MLNRSILLIVTLVPSVASAQWYGTVDFMAPTRSSTDENVFQRDISEIILEDDMELPVPTGVFQVGTESQLDLDFDFVAGVRGTIGYGGRDFGVEGSYLFTDRWHTMSSVRNASGLLASPFTAPGSEPDLLVDNNTFASVAYQTKLESAEINFTYRDAICPNGLWMWKFGIRGLWLDEDFEYLSTNAVQDNTLRTSTDNRIIGPQIGYHGRTPLHGGYLALSLSGMVGYNDINRSSDFNGVTGFKNTDEGTLAGDASIEYWFVPFQDVFVRVGYQVLGISSVGLAPNDPRINDNQTEGVVYQLPFIGVVLVR